MEITLAVAGVIALITAIVQVAKGLGLKKQYSPVLAIVLGIAYFIGVSDLNVIAVVNGLASGLTAVGLYSVGGKTILSTLSGKK